MKYFVSLLSIFLTNILFCQNLELQDQYWQPNDIVKAIHFDSLNSKLYIGGEFKWIGPPNPYGSLLETINANADLEFPKLNSSVYASISDEKGGFFIGGNFTKVGDSIRNRIAHIDSNNQITSMFSKIGFDDQVLSLELVNNNLFVGGSFISSTGNGNNSNKSNSTLINLNNKKVIKSFPDSDGRIYAMLKDKKGGFFIGGNFSRIGDSIRDNFAHIDSLGNIDSWRPSFNGTILTFDLVNNELLVGGDFTFINGIQRNYLAKLNTITKNLSSWNPNPLGSIKTIAHNGNNVFIGGNFQYINSNTQLRSNIASIDLITGNLNSWNTPCDYMVNKIIVSGPLLYIGGFFTSVGGQTRNHIATIHINSGLVTSWNPNVNGEVFNFQKHLNKIYIVGDFDLVDGIQRNNFAKLDSISNSPDSLILNSDNKIHSIKLIDSTIYLGGEFSLINNISRNNFASINSNSKNINSWNPNPNGSVFVIENIDSLLYIGGQYNSINQVVKNRIASINIATGILNNFNPIINNDVNSIHFSDSNLYLGGIFTKVNSISRERVVSMDTMGNIKSWAPQFNGSVFSIKSSGNNIYIGGGFNSVNNQLRRNLVSISKNTGQLNTWAPTINSHVKTMAISNDSIFIGGLFTTINNSSRDYLASLDLNSGVLHNWNPNLASKTNSILKIGNTIYAAGEGNTGSNNKGTKRVSAIDATTGQLLSWNPIIFNGIISTISSSNNKLFIGGSHQSAGGLVRQGIAELDTKDGSVTPWNPLIYGFVNDITSSNNSVFVGGDFTDGLTHSLIEVNKSSGIISNWSPIQTTGPVNSLLIYNNTLIVGGDFNSVLNQTRNNIAFFDLANLQLEARTLNTNHFVYTLKINNSTLYVGGRFSLPRPILLSYNLSNSQLTPWNPAISVRQGGGVTAMDIRNQHLYIGGEILSVNQTSRSSLASINLINNQVTSWNPDFNYYARINTISAKDTTIYIGGYFNKIGPYFPINNFAALNTTTGSSTKLHLGHFSEINAIKNTSDLLFIGGEFSSIANESRLNFAVFFKPTCNNMLDLNVTNTNRVLTSNMINAQYQWLNCANGFNPIIGDTNQTFTPTVDGSYALELTFNNCKDTTSCISIKNVGVISNVIFNPFKIFPNPAIDNITITSSKKIGEIEIYNAVGERVLITTSKSKTAIINVVDFKPNVYFIRTLSEGNPSKFKKLILIK